MAGKWQPEPTSFHCAVQQTGTRAIHDGAVQQYSAADVTMTCVQLVIIKVPRLAVIKVIIKAYIFH